MQNSHSVWKWRPICMIETKRKDKNSFIWKLILFGKKSLKEEHYTCSFLPCLTIYYFSLARKDLISKKGQFSFPSQAEGIFPGKKLNPDFDLRIETLNLEFAFLYTTTRDFLFQKRLQLRMIEQKN